ncbi:MAG: AAA family ATPase [Minicystis sp.]
MPGHDGGDPHTPGPAGLLLDRLRVRDFRNLARVEIEPAPRLNVIAGNNGHGKTSLLEAIYFVATSRSFRTHRAAELVRHDAPLTSVAARFVEVSEGMPPLAREQTAAVERNRSVVRIDGNKPGSLSEYATRSPVIAFHPEELALSSGPAGGRRTMLDRLALFMSPASADHRARYTRALKARQELLRRAEGELDTAEIDAFEELCAVHGAAVTEARAAAAEALGRDSVARVPADRGARSRARGPLCAGRGGVGGGGAGGAAAPSAKGCAPAERGLWSASR